MDENNQNNQNPYSGPYGQNPDNQPQYNPNAQNAGQYGQSQYDPNAYGQSAGQYGQPQYDPNAYGQSAGQNGQPQYDSNAYGQNVGQYGQSQYDSNAYGQSAGQYGQPQYGQGAYGQNVGQYGQSQYDPNAQGGAMGMASVYEQTMNTYGNQAYKPSNPKKQKGIKIAIISVVAALVVIAAVVVIYMAVIRKTPQEAVQDAMEQTAETLAANSVAGAVGADEFDMENLAYSGEITIDSVEGYDQVSGSKLVMSGASKTDGDQMDVKFSEALTLGGETANFDFIKVGQKLYMSAPEFFTKTFVMDTASIASDLADKSAGEGGTVDSESLAKLIEDDLAPATENFKDAIVYEKVGKETYTDADGNSVKAQHYTVTITTDAVMDYTNDITDCLEKYIDSNLSDEMLESMNVTKTQLDQMINMLPSAVGMMFTKDMVVDVYVNRGMVAHMDFEYSFGSLGVDVACSSDYMGNDDEITDVNTNVDVSYGGTSVAKLTSKLANATSGDESKSDGSCSMVITYDGESVAFTGTSQSTYNKSTGAFSGKCGLVVPGEATGGESADMSIEYSGTLADVKKGKSFAVNDGKLSLTYNGTTYAQLSGKLTVGENTEDITAPSDSDVVDYSVLTGDDSELEQYTNTESAQKIIDAWESVLGSSASGIIDGYADSDGADSDTADSDATTEAATEATTQDDASDDTEESADYSKEVLVVGDHKIKVNDPDGMERSYASSYSISLNSMNDYVTYNGYEGYGIDEIKEVCSDTSAYDDWSDCTINDVYDGNVTAEDGVEVGYVVTQMTYYDSEVTYVYLIYPIDSDAVVCSIQMWDNDGKNIDFDGLCKTYIGAMEIQ